MKCASAVIAVFLSTGLPRGSAAEPTASAPVIGPEACSTSGCHGGAGPGRGAYSIWDRSDPHAKAQASLTREFARSMAHVLGIGDPAEATRCTVCHAPMRQVDPNLLASPKIRDKGVTCANCHGPEKNWLLSHTRADFPKDALSRLGMQLLSTPYERANSCVACHQNLDDALLAAKHPRLLFELDGMLVTQRKHWNEPEGFSHAQTWLVGQAVALREAAAQAKREPGERREAEILALRALLRATDTGWDDSAGDLVGAADDYARRVSGMALSHGRCREILGKLLADRAPFRSAAFSGLARGYYAERLALAIDRLNETLIVSGAGDAIADGLLDDLFASAKSPESFEDAADAAADFIETLDLLGNAHERSGPPEE